MHMVSICIRMHTRMHMDTRMHMVCICIRYAYVYASVRMPMHLRMYAYPVCSTPRIWCRGAQSACGQKMHDLRISLACRSRD